MAITISKDDEQDAVLRDTSPRLFVESPPGSGKTLTAVRLAARDIEFGRVGSVQRVLLLTFSRAARSQLDRYAQQLLVPETRGLVEITNYHSFFWQKLSQFRQALGLPLQLDIATDTQHEQDVLGAMTQAGLPTPVTQRQRRQALRDYSAALEYSLDVGLPERFEGERPDQLAEVGARLAAVHRGGRLHYDDMAYYMWRLVNSSETLREIWRWKYPVIVLDEYQDASPVQAAIVRRLADQAHRVYAFADPLQMIYGWRDASPSRLEDFRAEGASEHRLRTLHRFQGRPELRVWMEQVRDVLLGDRERVNVPRPTDIEVLTYDATLPERGLVYGAPSRELYQLRGPISRAFADPDFHSIGVLARRRDQIAVLLRSLTQTFRCGLLGDADFAADWVREWMAGYAAAATTEHHVERLINLAETVAPRHRLLGDLRERVCPTGIRTDRLRAERRSLAEQLNALTEQCETLAGAVVAARETARIVTSDQDGRTVAWERHRVLQRVLRVLPSSTDDEAREQVEGRVLQLRFSGTGAPDRGLFLLSCHEGKGKEFDLVVLPWLSTDNFGDDDESRQLLYVSLTRARRRVLARVARGQVPNICERIGLA